MKRKIVVFGVILALFGSFFGVFSHDFGDKIAVSGYEMYARPTGSRTYEITETFTFGANDKKHNNQSGIYIIRDTELDGMNDPLAAFMGYIAPFTQGISHTYFNYTAVKYYNEHWYTAQEYAEERGQSKIGVSDWFYIDNNAINPRMGVWELPLIMPAGKYGIRARALKKEEVMTEEGRKTEYNNIIEQGVIVDYFFTIMYADDLTNIKLVDDYGRNKYVVRSQGSGRSVNITISGNQGAIRSTNALQSTQGFRYGELSADSYLNFYWGNENEVSVEVTFNSVATNVIGWRLIDGYLKLDIPKNLETGRYLVTITHNYKNMGGETIIGTYLIDNGAGDGFFENLFTGPNFGIFLIVLGLVGLGAGIILVYSKQFAWLYNKLRYKTIDAKIYGTDATTVKKKEKAEKAHKEAIKRGEIKKDPSDSQFLLKLAQARQLREEARKHGLTVEQYKQLEIVSLEKNEVGKYSLKDVRKKIGGEVEIIEAPKVAAKPKHYDGEIEASLLDTARQEILTDTTQLDSIDKTTREEVVTPVAPINKGILGRISKAVDAPKKPSE